MAAPRAPAARMTPSMQTPPPILGPPGPRGLPGIPGPPLETLEQRLYDLLAPFRENDFDADSDDVLPSRKGERKALILCENVAFLIRHNQASYGKYIEPNDVSFATKSWAAKTIGKGLAGIAIFVNGNGFSHNVLRATIGKDDDVVDSLSEKADEMLQQFFPGIRAYSSLAISTSHDLVLAGSAELALYC